MTAPMNHEDWGDMHAPTEAEWAALHEVVAAMGSASARQPNMLAALLVLCGPDYWVEPSDDSQAAQDMADFVAFALSEDEEP
jgi:hypothetical protein